MKRICPIFAFLFLASMSLVRAADRPNILFIAIDDLRPETGAAVEQAWKGDVVSKAPSAETN